MNYPDNVKKYFTLLDQWMQYFGFSTLGVESNWLFDKAYGRDRVEATKFGKVNCFSFVKYQNEPYTPAKFEQFSKESFNYGSKIRQGNPLGLGGMLVVYPCLIVEKATQEQINFLGRYVNKHFASNEFPSLVELSTGDLYCYPRTPMWGALYYDGYRKESRDYFSPKAWQRISAGVKK
jgi:hypothetical protein